MSTKGGKILNVKVDVGLLKTKILDAKDSALNKIKEGRNYAVSGILGKTIELSKKQVDVLQNVKKNFD
jgi:hypothetical protein